jgi:hypothetical protein
MDTSVQVVEISMLRYIPELVAWGIGIILGVIMVRRGGGKAEKLFLAGCCLMFVAPLASLLLNNWLSQLALDQSISYIDVMQSPLWIAVSVIMVLLGLVVLICLIWAFWARFRTKKAGAVR